LAGCGDDLAQLRVVRVEHGRVCLRLDGGRVRPLDVFHRRFEVGELALVNVGRDRGLVIALHALNERVGVEQAAVVHADIDVRLNVRVEQAQAVARAGHGVDDALHGVVNRAFVGEHPLHAATPVGEIQLGAGANGF
jgi:hypothetical protein